MKLAASNIAWQIADDDDDDAVAALLRRHQFTGVEIAPTKYWPDLTRVSNSALATCRQYWAEQNLTISSLQALLFGQPDLQIFGSPTLQARTLEYLRHVCHIGAALGASILVFGAPKNRQRGTLSATQAHIQAQQFFQQLGNIAQQAGVTVCIEPNPPAYGCDFITTAAEGSAFVANLNHPNLGLHLDAAAMQMVNDPINFNHTAPLQHFHASEPQLKPIGSGTVTHADYAAALRASHYRGWVSVEMRAATQSTLTVLAQALSHAQAAYGHQA